MEVVMYISFAAFLFSLASALSVPEEHELPSKRLKSPTLWYSVSALISLIIFLSTQ